MAQQAPSSQSQIGERADQDLLHAGHIGRGVGHPAAAATRHGEDRIADQLSRSVVGHLAAAVGLHHRASQRLYVDEQVFAPAAAAESHHMGVFQQQEVVIEAVSVETSLQRQSIEVLDAAEPADPQHGPVDGLRRWAQRISASQSRVPMMPLTRCRKAAA